MNEKLKLYIKLVDLVLILTLFRLGLLKVAQLGGGGRGAGAESARSL